VPRDCGGDPGKLRPDGGGTKKLILAFHFTLSRPAGWDCETCRKKGLEAKRRCAWHAVGQAGEPRVVWARRGVASEECPRPRISAQSHAWIELYATWKRTGRGDVMGLEARDADALALLEAEWERERDEQQRR
jgi:hypothetical protein